MLKEIDQKSIVKLYLCIMCIAILVVILLSCLFKKNNKEKKILFSSSICLLISINILEIIINYYKGYVRNYPFLYDIDCVKDILGNLFIFSLGTYICYETSLLSKNKLIKKVKKKSSGEKIIVKIEYGWKTITEAKEK